MTAKRNIMFGLGLVILFALLAEVAFAFFTGKTDQNQGKGIPDRLISMICTDYDHEYLVEFNSANYELLVYTNGESERYNIKSYDKKKDDLTVIAQSSNGGPQYTAVFGPNGDKSFTGYDGRPDRCL